MSNVTNWIRLSSIQIVVAGFSFFAGDYIYTNYLRVDQQEIYRIRHDVYHHALVPSYDGIGNWGGVDYRICTDGNGFKSACENVHSSQKNYDIAFIGDSFTEAIGMSYEDSFVGMFASDNPNLNIVNLGISSSSPTIYRAKIEDLIARGYTFNHVVIFIDISDVKDETWYFRDEFGRVVQDPKMGDYRICTDVNGLKQLCESLGQDSLLTRVKRHVIDNFALTTFAYRMIRKKDAFSREDSEWTYNLKSTNYGELGVNYFIEKAVREITLLHRLLDSNDIKLSIGVYPWPAQLVEMAENIYDENLQVSIWRKYCAKDCSNFINMFPEYLNLILKSSVENVYEGYFIQGDVHFNREGNRLIYEALMKSSLNPKVARLPKESEG